MNCALVCFPANTVDQGNRMRDLGKIDTALAKRQHAEYCYVLDKLGYRLIAMPADDRFPDSVFVEDPGVIIEDHLIITHLRKENRKGEVVMLEAMLRAYFNAEKIHHIEGIGCVEGGDVVVAESEKRLYIGLPERTDANGAAELARIAFDAKGYRSTIFEIPKHYLHLKGEVTYHGSFFTVSEEIADNFKTSGLDLMVTPAEERFGGNCISRGPTILVHARRPRTKKLLDDRGFATVDIEMSEFEKIDGAMTCMSKLFQV